MDRRILYLSASLLFSSAAFAAAPTVTSVGAASVNAGTPVSLQATVADTDGDLKTVTFSLTGPGISGTQTLASSNVSTGSASVTTPWTAPGTGLYTLTVQVADQAAHTASASASFDVFAGSTTINPITVPNGTAWMVEVPGQILTTENDTATAIDVQSGSNVILWSGGRVTLMPGFHAENGSFFWATVDHNMNGYSDMEEATDSDGDGIPDAWEVDHGLNPNNASDAGQLASDGSGLTNLQEYQRFVGNGDPSISTYNVVLPAAIATQLGLSHPTSSPLNDTSNTTGLIIHVPSSS
ncbi:MAG TPA: thrombospondin type 3 repeat-containing protein [Opitutaceae bacterium]